MRILWFSSRERLQRRQLGRVVLLRGLLGDRLGRGVLLIGRGRSGFLLEVAGNAEEWIHG